MTLNHQAKVLVALLCIDFAVAQEDRSLLPQDYKCGISIRYSGIEGVDWIAEEHYHEPLQNNRRTVYIKDTTEISMFHNELNVLAIKDGKYHPTIGAVGLDGIPDSGDEGIIRYRIDGDLHHGLKWSDRATGTPTQPNHQFTPAYTAPFTFAELTYAPVHPSVSVVGATGDNGQPVTEKMSYFHYGILDSAGDEWHTMCIGDDDWATLPTEKTAFWSSDGKMQSYVVNPKTPCITVEHAGNAQFYTTPAKVYFIPKIHDQITYIAPRTGSVTVKLTDINGNVVHYRINGGSYQNNGTNTVTLTDADFSNGENTLECYYAGNEALVRTRKIVKNPPFPSAGESHGHLMWGTEAEFNKIKERRLRAPYFSFWDSKLVKDWKMTGRFYWPSQGMKGKRWPWYPEHAAAWTRAFENAFVALIQGWNWTASGESKTSANFAKEMMLDNVLNLDYVGFELTRHLPSPTTEIKGAGYYMVKNTFSFTAAYDILIAHYRSDQHANGITPIEDHFMRDQMAANALRQMQWHGDWVGINPGMWGTAEGTGAFMIALAMPNYDTPYYGTSGFNGAGATHEWTPYPDHPRTWKQVFSDDVTPSAGGYPNHRHRYSPTRSPQAPTSDGTMIGVDGEAFGYWEGANMGYYELMSQQYLFLTNLCALHTGRQWPAVDQSYLYSVQKLHYGAFGKNPVPNYYQMLQAINERHPSVALAGLQGLIDHYGGTPWINGIDQFIWFDDVVDNERIQAVDEMPLIPKGLRLGD
jgi:hypothetical protein